MIFPLSPKRWRLFKNVFYGKYSVFEKKKLFKKYSAHYS